MPNANFQPEKTYKIDIKDTLRPRKECHSEGLIAGFQAKRVFCRRKFRFGDTLILFTFFYVRLVKFQ